MPCQRCKGLLVRETFGDLTDEAGCMSSAIRCINCGYIEDSVVRANRLGPPTAKRSMPRGIVWKGGAVFLKSHAERYRSVCAEGLAAVPRRVKSSVSSLGRTRLPPI
jgi:hypothetical protein